MRQVSRVSLMALASAGRPLLAIGKRSETLAQELVLPAQLPDTFSMVVFSKKISIPGRRGISFWLCLQPDSNKIVININNNSLMPEWIIMVNGGSKPGFYIYHKLLAGANLLIAPVFL